MEVDVHALERACSLKWANPAEANVSVSFNVGPDRIKNVSASGADANTLKCVTDEVRTWQLASACPSGIGFRLQFLHQDRAGAL